VLFRSLHIGSMNGGMKDLLNVMSKFLVMGMSLDDVILRSTWNPAREIKREELGNLSVGAIADVAVLRLEKGNYGFVDIKGGRLRGNQKLVCELTLRDGKVVYDLNGITSLDWDQPPRDSK
jgi:dihydroorotase